MNAIALLSTWNAPDLPEYLDAMREAGVPIAAVICAGECSEEHQRIVTERTAGYFTPRSIVAEIPSEVPFHFVKDHNDENCVSLVGRLGTPLLGNAGTPNILKAEILSVPDLGILNAHPGRLPEYRGCTAVEWSVIEGAQVAVTCHLMDEGIDSGPIVSIQEMRLTGITVYEQLRAAMIGFTAGALAEGARAILAGEISPEALPAQGAGIYRSVFPANRMEELRRRLPEYLAVFADSVD